MAMKEWQQYYSITAGEGCSIDVSLGELAMLHDLLNVDVNIMIKRDGVNMLQLVLTPDNARTLATKIYLLLEGKGQ